MINTRNLFVAILLCACGMNLVHAQTMVQLYGVVDMGIGRRLGNGNNQVMESADGNSRFGFKGSENLGSGYSANFILETRFKPDTGELVPANRLFHGISTVGIGSPYGSINLGRQYTAAFSLVQNQVDPWVAQSVAQLRHVGMQPGATVGSVSGSPAGVPVTAKTRRSDSVRYDLQIAKFSFAADVGEKLQEGGAATGPDRPWSIAGNYNDGTTFLGISYEDPQFSSDSQWNIAARYVVGPATFMGGVATGRTSTDLKLKGAQVGVNYLIGQGEIKVGYAKSEIGQGQTAVLRNRSSLGYWHKLSNRTRIYADLAHESRISTFKRGFDLGIIHTF